MHSKYWLNNNNRQVYIMQLSRRFAMTALSAAVLTAVYAPQVTANEGISDNEIRIGYLADMSGVYRDPIGPLGEDAIHMAIEDVGGSVQGANIVVFSADDRNSPDVGSSVVREWIDERNVDMVTGLVASSVTLAAVSLLQEADKLGLVNGAVSSGAASGITSTGCTSSIGPN